MGAIRAEAVRGILDSCQEHAVVKELPIRLPDGSWAKGVKRERFLTDFLLAQEYVRAQGGNTTADRARSDSRTARWANQMVSTMLEHLRAGDPFTMINSDIGEKRPGDLVVYAYRVDGVKHGSVGVIYLCEDVNDGERVAIKSYTDEVRWCNPGFVRRFRHEANTWAALNQHPNVIEVLEVRDVDGRLHMILEYAEGGDLRSRLRSAIPSTAEAVRIGLDICAGLGVIHNAGLVHRDIKPENILFGADGTAKVSDLGLVMALVGDGAAQVVGTRGYWAPEQVVTPERVTAAADVYAVGVVLYELLTGLRPSAGSRSPLDRNPALPELLGSLVAACLGLDPDARPTVEALASGFAVVYRELTGLMYNPPLTAPRRPLTFSRIRSLMALDDHEEALRLCDEHLVRSPHDRRIRHGKALCLYGLGRYQDCVCTCLDILRRPTLGYADIAKDVDHLITMCGEWLGLPGRDAGMWVTLGQMMAIGAGDTSAALLYAELALKTDRRDGSSWYFKAQCLYSLGHYQESLATYEQAKRFAETTQMHDVARHGAQRCRAILSGDAAAQFRTQRDLVAARNYLDAGDPAAAEPLLRRIVAATPVSPGALADLGAAVVELGRPKDALELLDQALALDPHNRYTWLQRARTLRLLRRYCEALESAEHSLTMRVDAIGWQEKAKCLLRMLRFAEAEEGFVEALRLDPGNETSQRGLEICSAMLAGETPDTTYPLHHWQSQSVEHWRNGRRTAALDCLRTALDLEPDDVICLNNTGYILWEMGQYNAAVRHCQRVVELDPRFVHAWNILGNALDDLGREGEALAAFDRAIELNSEYADAWNGRGLCLRALGDHEQALASFRRACTLEPALSRAWFNYAETHAELGHHEQALQRYDQALTADPNNGPAYNGKGLALHHLGRHTEAVTVFGRAIEVDPRNPDPWNNLGAMHVMLGEYAEAAKCLQRCLALDPRRTEAHRNLERIRLARR